ncbi:phospholipase A2-like [Centruroides vittatus]|uniref:phospholipase A2-like n=1 Tax=Centruroides vittatus TaxID=120091 RepID=UPI003510C49A
MVEVIRAEGIVSDCYLYGDSFIIEQMLDSVPSNLTRTVSEEELKQQVDNCTSLLLNNLQKGFYHVLKTPFDNIRKFFRRFLIFPGTKWCGAGNIADDYEDLGSSREADKCCRVHDHCNVSISGFGEDYQLKNKDFYTKSHCDCDDTFYSCLSHANTSTSKTVGNTFFNYLQIECFKEEYPIVKCLKTSRIRRRCLKYLLNKRKPKKYQFFDAKPF